jgi:hypothetical protein
MEGTQMEPTKKALAEAVDESEEVMAIAAAA